MHPSLHNFLTTLGQVDFNTSYNYLFSEFDSESDKRIADELKKIMTSHFVRERQTKSGGLLRLKMAGFNPSIVYDVGAQVGTPELYNTFPEAHHVLIEPVAECQPTLKNIASRIKSAQIYNCAISNINGRVPLSVSESKQYASIGISENQEIRDIESKTIDSISEEINIAGANLLKIDVDGFEIEVLMGSKNLLLDSNTVVLIEASMGDKNPRFNKIVEYLTQYEFNVYDIVDTLYRPSDWHLWQVDLIFIKKNASFWTDNNFY